MLKTFFASPIAGALAAVVGWIAAILFKDSMTAAEFANLRFGWEGALIGAIAIASLLMLFLAGDVVEPIVMAVCAAVGAAFLWNRQELPFSTSNYSGTTATYWFTVAMMIVVFLLLLMGLRAARESSTRAR